MNNDIKKPITVARVEFMEALADLINESSLPFFVVEYVIRDMLDEIGKISQKQYNQDRQQYEEAVANKNSVEPSLGKKNDKGK